MSGDGHDYEGKYGTQEEQAAKQASVGKAKVDGPWRLTRRVVAPFGTKKIEVVLPNSARSTYPEIVRLQNEELVKTGIWWSIKGFKKSEGQIKLTLLRNVAKAFDQAGQDSSLGGAK